MFPDIQTRRTPVVSFSHMFKEELDKSVKRYLKSCVKAQTYVDPTWIRGRTLPSLDELRKKEKKKKENKLKRKATEEGPDAKQVKKQKKPKESLKVKRTDEHLEKLIHTVYHSSDRPPQKKPHPSVIPSSSTTTNRNQPLLSTHVQNPQPQNATFP